MRRSTIFLLLATACGPEPAPMQPDTTSADSTGVLNTSTSAAPTSGATTGDGLTTGDVMSSTGATPGTSTTGSTTGGESTTDASSTTGEPAACCLVPNEPTSSVQADTPVGARTLPWATFSVSGGECGGSRLMFLYPEPSGIGTDWGEIDNIDYLRIDISAYMNMWPNGFMGTGPAAFLARFDGKVAMTEGEITILEIDDDVEDILWCSPEDVPVDIDAHVTFTIALKADGWDVAGQVTADYCPALNQICP